MSDGMLPSGWELASVGQVAHRVVVGFVGPSKKHYTPGGVPFLMGKNIREWGLKLEDLERVSAAFHARELKSQLAPGDVVVVRIGKSGTAAVIPETLGAANCGGLIVVKQPRATSSRYLALYLNSPEGQKASKSEARGMTRQTLNTRSVELAQVPVAPLNEQRRIVEKIDALFAHSKKAKESLDRIPALLEKLKKSILAAAFRGDLTKDWREAHPDLEPADQLLARIRTERRRRWEEAELAKMRAKGKEPKNGRWKERYEEPVTAEVGSHGELPPKWTWASFEEITENHDGARVPVKRELRASTPGAYPYFGASGVIDHVDDFLFDGDFLLIAEDGANLLARSSPIAFRATGQFWVNNHAHVVQSLGAIPLEFLEHQMESKDLRFSVTGTAQPKLTQAALGRLPIALAPLEEQAIIATIVSESLNRLSAIAGVAKATRARVHSLEQGVLSKAFRGELVPQDPNDEPASDLLERIRAERAAVDAGPSRTGRRARRAAKPADPQPTAQDPEPVQPRRIPIAPIQPAFRFDTNFLQTSKEAQARMVAHALFGHGPLAKDEAVKRAAEHLRDQGLAHFQRLRSAGELHAAITTAIDTALKLDLLDRPARGQVRATKVDPQTYLPEDWSLCVSATLNRHAINDEDAIRLAADWAAANLGLQFQRLRPGGVIHAGLAAALLRARQSDGRSGTKRSARNK